MNGQLNGKAERFVIGEPVVKAKKKPAKKKSVKKVQVNKVKLGLTVALGIAIPLLSLSLSKIAGQLAMGGHVVLPLFATALTVAVLGVSLTHLAWAIDDITRSGWWVSVALAITIDLALVLGELVQVFASDLGLGIVTAVLMGAVCVFSMVLNVWAFIQHK